MQRNSLIFQNKTKELIEVGSFFHQRGWAPATSGNYSARLPENLAITVSGSHKGELTSNDIMIIDGQANRLETALPNQKSSAETLIHTLLYQKYPEVDAVLHVHSLHSTLISQVSGSYVELEGYVEDIARFLRSREFRVGLLFTNYEGQPNAILDYIESGIPVVATDLQPIKEVLSKENESFLYSNYHVDQICQGIIEISNSKSN